MIHDFARCGMEDGAVWWGTQAPQQNDLGKGRKTLDMVKYRTGSVLSGALAYTWMCLEQKGNFFLCTEHGKENVSCLCLGGPNFEPSKGTSQAKCRVLDRETGHRMAFPGPRQPPKRWHLRIAVTDGVGVSSQSSLCPTRTRPGRARSQGRRSKAL